MHWDLFVELLDKFEFVIPHFYEEEYELDEVYSVASTWLEVELVCRCCYDECFSVAYSYLCQRIREYYNMLRYDERVKALEARVALLDLC